MVFFHRTAPRQSFGAAFDRRGIGLQIAQPVGVKILPWVARLDGLGQLKAHRVDHCLHCRLMSGFCAKLPWALVVYKSRCSGPFGVVGNPERA